MKILSWNVRGLGSPSKRALIKDTISYLCPDFVILSETKLASISKRLIKSMWSSIRINWMALESTGSSGGILNMWDDLNFSVSDFVKGQFSLSIKISLADGFSWWLSGIYGPASRKYRGLLWRELYDLYGLCNDCWLLGGDFNVFRWSSETSSINPAKKSMRKFNNFISSTGLIDPPLLNGSYTRSNLRNSPIRSRLDRFLYSYNWALKFGDHTSKRLSRITSDHFPILLDSPSVSWGPCPFRFDNYLLKNKSFLDKIEHWWISSSQDGHPGYSFIRHLRQLAKSVKAWKKTNMENLKSRKKSIADEIDRIDSLEALGPIDDTLRQQRVALKTDILEVALQEARYWSQRCKKIWLFEGDENTSFFHKMCTARRRRSHITELMSKDGSSIASDD